MNLADCIVTRVEGKTYVKDGDGVVALRISPVRCDPRGAGRWIDAFGGVFSAEDVAQLEAFVAAPPVACGASDGWRVAGGNRAATTEAK